MCQVPEAMGPGGRAARLTRAAPNKALEPTPYSVRSFLASASGRGSPLALGFDRTVDRQWIQSEGETNASSGNRK